MEAPLLYFSFLLRLWQVQEATGFAWRATLKDARTGEQRGFASLEGLIAYLRHIAEAGSGEAEGRVENDSS